MPETTMNKDERLVHRKDEIRFARQMRVVDAIAKAIGMKCAPQQQLWLGVLASNAGHHSRASLFVYNICHMRSTFASESARIGVGL